MRTTDTRVYFWGGVLSNWSTVKDGIEIPGELRSFRVPTSEHVFMYIKARYFGDLETAKEILEAKTPKEAKKLGRKVRDFDEKKWENYRETAMWNALNAKYWADKEFRNFLMMPEFEGHLFVEASPYDRIWGCGLSEDDPKIDLPEDTWPGLNLLGKLLTRLRNER